MSQRGIGRRGNLKYGLRDVLPCCFGNSDGKRGFGRKARLFPSRALRKSVYVCPHMVYVFVYECVNLSQQISACVWEFKGNGPLK